MAIQFARARFLGRRTGGNAVRTAAYNGRDDLKNERTGERFYFKHRGDLAYHEILLPEGADPKFLDAKVLWNAAELAERRSDSQVAMDMVLALPANLEISDEDRNELVRSFVQEHFVSKGLGVQFDVHAPHEVEAEDEAANWHAHVLVTTRRIEGARLAAKKARDLNPEFRRFGSKAYVNGIRDNGVAWRDHQNAFFRAHGYEVRVDPTAARTEEHLGPVRMRKPGTDLNKGAVDQKAAQEAAARDPAQILQALTRNNATFSEYDLDRFLAKHVKAAKERDGIKVAVLLHREVLALHDRETGEATGRFTTSTVREEEKNALAQGAAIAVRDGNGVASEVAQAVAVGAHLRADQRAAFDHAVEQGGLKIIEGRAGTGKSYTLSAIRVAHVRDDYRVLGLAPTNAVALDLKANGFTEARTIHSALFRLKNGRESWDEKTVLVVDEAAMMDTRILGELLSEAREAGAKVVLAGDDRQLASIERGGLFSELRAAHGSVEINEVTRQRDPEQRQAARDLAEGRFHRAVETFDRIGAISWSEDQATARAELIEAWAADVAADPQATRFVFAYTNDDVDALNLELRAVRRRRGELGEDVSLPTRRGMTNFAVGDRVQFTDTDKGVGVVNGNVGRIARIERFTQRVTVELDAAGGKPGRTVSWTGASFSGVRHGYAGTIYKGQGKTLDHTYLYHSLHWRNAASYVALTRQRESAKVFVARETAKDVPQLARQMGRSENKAASMAYATAEEIKLDRAANQAARQAGQDAAGKQPGAKLRPSRDDLAADRGGSSRARPPHPHTPGGASRPVEPVVQDNEPDDETRQAAATRAAQERIRARVTQGWFYEVDYPRDLQALKKQLHALDDDLLRNVILTAYVSLESDTRLTAEQVACELDGGFRKAFGYAERLRQDKTAVLAEMKDLDSTISYSQRMIEVLDERDGLLRRVMRGMNLVENQQVRMHEGRIFEAAERKLEIQARLDRLIPELADAERAADQAYQGIDGDPERERAERNRLSDAADQVLTERLLAREQEERLEYERSRDQEQDLDPDLEPDNEIEL